MELEKYCRNFSEFDKQLLVGVVSRHSTIECKMTHKKLQKAKQLAWATLIEEFCSISGIKRDASQLKTVSRYETIHCHHIYH